MSTENEVKQTVDRAISEITDTIRQIKPDVSEREIWIVQSQIRSLCQSVILDIGNATISLTNATKSI